jgi:hypothetical protein
MRKCLSVVCVFFSCIEAIQFAPGCECLGTFHREGGGSATSKPRVQFVADLSRRESSTLLHRLRGGTADAQGKNPGELLLLSESTPTTHPCKPGMDFGKRVWWQNPIPMKVGEDGEQGGERFTVLSYNMLA